MGRRPNANRFSGLNNLDNSRAVQPPARNTRLENTRAENPPPANSQDFANSQALDSGTAFSARPQSKPAARTASRSLYSNFDSDLRRAQTSSLNTSIRRPASTLTKLPAGKRVVDRKVKGVEYQQDLPEVPDPQAPRINPFPFKLN